MLLWSLSGQSTSVMLRDKNSILDVVCHVAMCLVTQLAGTLFCATGQSLRHISNRYRYRYSALRSETAFEDEGIVPPKGPETIAQ